MSRKRKHAEREKWLLELAKREGRLANGMVIPEGAIAADLSAQAKNNSYGPPLYYLDQPFTCVDCGAEEVWTAAQQKWYFEVAKGSIYGRAIRCRACRRKRREMQAKSASVGDPNPIKHAGSLIKYIRSKIEPTLVAAGFVIDGRSKAAPIQRYPVELDYSRPGELVRIGYEHRDARLIAELIDAREQFRSLAIAQLTPRSSIELEAQLDEFVTAVKAGLPCNPRD